MTIEKTFYYYEIWQFAVNYESVMFYDKDPGACIIKHYGFVIYRKWTDFVVT